MNGEQAYQNALRRRAELRQELDEIETFLRLYEKYVSLAGSVQDTSAIKGDLTMGHADNSAPTPDQPPEHVAGMALVPHIRRVILDIGRPQSRSGVVKALSDRGIQVGGQDPVTNVGTIMWRAKQEFINLKPHGYWPRDVAYAAVGYDPAQDAEPDEEDRKENGSAAAADGGSSADLWGR
jgi:hypothetical protein